MTNSIIKLDSSAFLRWVQLFFGIKNIKTLMMPIELQISHIMYENKNYSEIDIF